MLRIPRHSAWERWRKKGVENSEQQNVKTNRVIKSTPRYTHIPHQFNTFSNSFRDVISSGNIFDVF